ncbi:ABC transporter permease [Pedobacter caeni]|uniref:ABC-type antimicrobial peptide transport system, permease component n=1 Tax=Pedobacter caeni TaxID=288992 RepID=A0A1M5HPD9_9SPHI|nr:ABC transporter permease [Pedobacter caeni]SHG17805.1 ABC-type antimicrobial peptide transport system, permease component [Pedobacter caeni]
MFRTNLKIALRNLWRSKGFTLINVGGLAIGLACTLMLLLFVNYEWSYNKQFADVDRTYFAMINLKINGELVTTMASPNKLGPSALQSIPGVENATRIAMGTPDKLFSYRDNNFKLKGLTVDPSFLKIFDYRYIYGDANTALKDPNSILLTASMAKKLFGNENPVGKIIKWDNRKFLNVAAVIEDLPKNQSIQFDALQTWALFEQENPSEKENGWGAITCMTIIKLKDKQTYAATDLAIRKLIPSKDKETSLEAFLFPYSELHLYNEFKDGKSIGGRIKQVKLFVFLAFCVLLIASINYMNLSTARSEKRAREVGIRKAMGSSRISLMGQFILESLLLSFIATSIAFVLLEISLPYFNHLLDIEVQVNYQSYLFWTTLVALVCITGFLAGSYPAFYLSSFSPIRVLKGFKGNNSSSLSIRKVLVVVQFSLSVGMIICAIIIYSQIQFMKNKPLGFERDGLVQLDIEGEWIKPGKLELFKTELKKAGAVVYATEFASTFTQGGTITGGISWPGKAANDNSVIDYRSIGYDFIKTIGAKLVAGRDLNPKFSADTSTSVLINEQSVKTMGLKNPVGTTITWGDNPPLTIIGVVKDYSNEAIGRKTKPTLFYFNPAKSRILLLRLNPSQPLNKSAELINMISKRLNPEYPAALRFVNQGMEEQLRNEKLLSTLSNLFGGFAILISCLGLLGLALYMAEQRNKEISIRKVLGADLRNILILLNKDFIKLVLFSNMIAFPIAYMLAKNWLSKYDYKIDIALWPFLIAGLISLFISVLTVSLQTFKVAKANAVDALKYE